METDLPIAEFGFPGPLREKLVSAILRGEKTSTTGLLEEYRSEGTPFDPVGTRELLVDSSGHGIAVIETTEVEVRRMGDVDLAFVIDEGEGFETLAEWREAHVRFFTSPEMVSALGDPPVPIDDDTLVVCTRFRVVQRLERCPGGNQNWPLGIATAAEESAILVASSSTESQRRPSVNPMHTACAPC